MSDAAATLRPLIDELVEQVLKQYRIERSAAHELISASLVASAALREACLKDPAPDRLKRTRAFRDAATEAKKRVYYALRQYRPGESTGGDAVARLRNLPRDSVQERDALVREIVGEHRSTSERLPTIDEFYRNLFSLMGEPRSILDVGCGVQPLVFPFDGHGRSVEHYLAVDKDEAAIEAVQAYGEHRGDSRLVGQKVDVGDGWPAMLRESPIQDFDAAFFFKLTPVIERQQLAAMNVLFATPAKRWIVTGSCVGLAKRRDIERRERASILRFIESSGRRMTGEFTVGEEFGFAAE